MPTMGDPGRKVGGRTALSVFLLGGLVLGGSAPARAQNYTGPSKCVGCHDHERQAKKWQKEEPAAYKGKAHFNTLKQLDAPKAVQWAKAIGLADPYDAKGSCVKCHGTVFRGEANAGVSCESCHGPSSNYNDLHQEKGSYAKAIAAGLRDLKEKPANIAKVCVECHLTTDKKLAAAGHPTGADFDGGASLQKLVHWDTNYNFAAITAATKAAMGGRALPAGPATTPAAPPAAPAGGAKAPVAAPAGVKPAEVPPATAGPAPAVPTPPAPGVNARKPTPPATPATPPAPWDWDQPVRALPDDYVPDAAEPGPAAAPANEAPAPVPVPQGTRETPPTPARRTPRPPPVVPPSLAEEAPLPKALPLAPPAPATAPAVESASAPAASAVPPAPAGSAVPRAPAAPAAPAAPRPAGADAVALRGQAVQVLEKLLRAGTRTKDAPAPAKPAEYSGPDSELLRLQDEVIALALEALRRPQ
jgi:hypothetical protein